MFYKDIRLGDYLQFSDRYPNKDLRNKIVYVVGNDGRIDVRLLENDKYIDSVHPDYLDGVDILAALDNVNGFVKQGFEGWLYSGYDDNNEYIYSILWNNVYNNGYLKISSFGKVGAEYGNFEKSGIWFVHELQHAICDCGMPKEIKLKL